MTRALTPEERILAAGGTIERVAPKPPADPLGIVSIGDAPPTWGGDYIAKGLIAPEQRVLLIGEPASGKSTLAPLLAHCIARGAPFLGFKTAPGPVLWIAAEDAAGTIRRFYALARELGPAPGIYVATATIDLLDPATTLPGAVAIRDAADRIGARLIVLDTLSASFPGINENDPVEMGHAVKTIRSLTSPTRATLTLHHVPKGGTSPRGHGVLLGDADVVLLVEADESGRRALRLRKNRNGPGIGAWGFRIKSVELGRDAEGDPVSAPAAEIDDYRARAPDRSARLGPNARTALRMLHDLLAEEGRPLPAAWGMASDLRAVPLERWRAYCRERGLTADPEAFRSAFRRAHAALLAACRIASREHNGEALVWPVRREEDEP